MARRYLYRYNEAANLPHHRKSTAKNFGFRDNDGNVHMLDKFGLYKIEYPDKCSQKNPYVVEDREWLDGNRKLREIMKVQQTRFVQRLYGLSKNWGHYREHIVQRQNSQCSNCGCKLMRRNVHVHYVPQTAGEHSSQRELIPDNLVASCVPCYRQMRQQPIRN